MGIIAYAVGRDAGIGTGERGRGVDGLLDEGGETQERRARRGRGRGAVGLGICETASAEGPAFQLCLWRSIWVRRVC